MAASLAQENTGLRLQETSMEAVYRSRRRPSYRRHGIRMLSFTAQENTVPRRPRRPRHCCPRPYLADEQSTAGVYSRRLQQASTAGVYSRRLQQASTAGVYGHRLQPASTAAV